MNLHPRIGIALSGGGARGIAHVGVLKALEENNISITNVAGTSMGAIVGVLFSAGYSSKEITQMLKDEKIYKWFKVEWFRAGLLSLAGVKEILSKYINSNDFDRLKLPFSVGVSNISRGRGEIVNKGSNLLDYVIASASVPVVFSPVVIKDNSYVDGGLFHNLPAEALVGQCEYIIGSNVNPIAKQGTIESVKHVGERIFNLAIAQNVWQSRTYCDFYIEPKNLREFSAWDYNKVDEIIEMGYKTALKGISKFILPEIKEEA